MARYVQDAKNILGELAPGFMELDSIETPPIDFADVRGYTNGGMGFLGGGAQR